MPRDFSQIGTYLLAALIVFAVYRRLRRTFGRQPLRPGRMMIRIGLFAVLAALLSPAALRSNAFAAAALAGLCAGIVLALWGASRTRFERSGAQLFYVPHTYTGVAVSLLFIGRVAFRLLQAYGVTQGVRAAPAAGAGSGFTGYVSSPLTLGLFFVLAGYYVCYLGLLLWKSKHLQAGEADDVPPPVGANSGTPS